MRAAGVSPRCPRCGEVLAAVLNHRVLTATDEAGTERDMLIRLMEGVEDIPGIVTEVRRREEDKQQTQTPVQETITPTPASER